MQPQLWDSFFQTQGEEDIFSPHHDEEPDRATDLAALAAPSAIEYFHSGAWLFDNNPTLPNS
jgi:hypothetical protein